MIFYGAGKADVLWVVEGNVFLSETNGRVVSSYVGEK